MAEQRKVALGDKVLVCVGKSWNEKRGVVTQVAIDRDGEVGRVCVVYENWVGQGREVWVYARDVYFL